MARKAARRGWGSGSITWRPDGLADIRWRENGRRRKQCGVPSHLAKKLLEEITDRVKEGAVGFARTSKEYKTIDSWATHWFSVRMTDANKGDQELYNLHLKPILGHLPFTAITPAFIREQVVMKLRKVPKRKIPKEGSDSRFLSGTTIKKGCRVMSSMFSDAIEEGLIEFNAWKGLGKKTRAMFKSDYDVKNAPWLKNPADIGRMFSMLPEPVNYFFAIGVMAGLRPGEIRGLEWIHIIWARKRISVVQQVSEREHRIKTCKDDDSRVVPLLPELEPILREWWQKCGCPTEGLVFPPKRSEVWKKAAEKRKWLQDHLRTFPASALPSLREAGELVRQQFGDQLDSRDVAGILKAVREGGTYEREAPVSGTKFLGVGTILKAFHTVRKALGLPYMRFYDSSRHTFATQWIVRGGTRDELKDILGHSTLEILERYVHAARSFEGEVGRNLFGTDIEAIRAALKTKDLGLSWKIEGRPEPTPSVHEEEEAV